MSEKLIRTLMHLAQADGNVTSSELALIYKIAMKKGLPMFEVEQLVQNPPKEALDLNELSQDDKFEYIYTIVLMMKMDGVLDDREFDMCSEYAIALGYKEEVIPYLLDLIKSDQELNENKKSLQQEIQKYLI